MCRAGCTRSSSAGGRSRRVASTASTTRSVMPSTSSGARARAMRWSSCPASARSARPPSTCASTTGRPRFTDPEILRSSLAGVILRMKSLGLGLVEDFPFLEPPPRRAIADGYQLLAELGAVDEQNELTAMGRELSKMPLDPRVGRMIVEARNRHALTEVLVIAAAMSVQDVRDRPLEHQQAADQAHKKFDDEKSEFIGDLKLWNWLEEGRGGTKEHKL